jgi:hypothetical protein
MVYGLFVATYGFGFVYLAIVVGICHAKREQTRFDMLLLQFFQALEGLAFLMLLVGALYALRGLWHESRALTLACAVAGAYVYIFRTTTAVNSPDPPVN